MSRPGRNRLPRIAHVAAFAAIAAIVGALATGCGGGSDSDDAGNTPTQTVTTSYGGPPEATTTTTPRGSPATTTTTTGPVPRAQRRPHTHRQVRGVVSAYIAALDTRNGDHVCALVEQSTLEAVDLPERRRGCSGSVDASIGYRDPRGRLPVWKSTRILRFRSVQVDGAQARVTVAVRTLYENNPEPSIEDDVVYLEHSQAGWLIAKPSVTFYRAIGVADVPPQVLSPP